MDALPAWRPVASPWLTVATFASELLHTAALVTSFCVPSLYIPVAVSWIWLPETTLGLGGPITTEVSLSAVPLPCSLKICGLPLTLSFTLTTADRLPTAVGWNTSVIWQFP